MLHLMRAAILTVLAMATVATGALEKQPTHMLPSCSQQQCTLNPLANTPSLRLRVTLKRKSMKVHGQHLFDVFTRPVISADGSSVRYDGFATFVKGDTQFTYMLVDGAAYVVETVGNGITEAATKTARCVPPPIPFESIVSALNNATVISSASADGEALECSDGSILQTSVGGQDFVICTEGVIGFNAYSGDMAVTVEYLDVPIKSISPPVIAEWSAACDSVEAYTTLTPTGFALLTGTGMPQEI
ncbi:hypothetical protein PHYBOEH_005646 [Phytophthora boehmeriae]|uniref:Uncharacterized protein n=1 Tax=Phytophthora boehmeriae TaxID=109152 RepID=A0A8T1WQY9_9STRA|nr:hypothetical protein PHYBOEH_005646 [Phytophthora boehmeriae]